MYHSRDMLRMPTEKNRFFDESSINHISSQPCHHYHIDGMELDSFPSPRYRKEDKAESTYADGYVDRQLPIQSVRIEVGRVHQHYRSRGYETYDHRPQTGKDAFDHTALMMPAAYPPPNPKMPILT